MGCGYTFAIRATVFHAEEEVGLRREFSGWITQKPLILYIPLIPIKIK